eukprot:jgi/Psemu1/249453/estExt_Genewise1Plus.C_50105
MAVEKYLIPLIVVGIIDAISYMLVTPSLVFYILENGGTKNQYGIIMSAFSFSSFCIKPVIGWWSDNQGFRVPYISTLLVALLGGVVYVFASALPNGTIAVGAILCARLLGGCGAANSALGFAYVARSVPVKKQTSINSLLSLCRILGMAIGPGINVLVSKVNVPVGNYWALNSLNSVGLIIVICNITAIVAIFYLLEEPQKDHDDIDVKKDSNLTTYELFLSVLSMDILVPMICIFGFNANFQLIETGFAPAASDGLGWGPVESSVALGSISFVIAAHMFVVMQLSNRGVSDANMLCGGLALSTVAYALLYSLWIKDTTIWNFYIPILLGASSFPYLAAPTRSIFTMAVNAKPALRNYHGSMQAVLSMGASVAGFTTPGIVATYCLRHPDDVIASSDRRELTLFSMFAPLLSLTSLIGVIYLRLSGILQKNAKQIENETDDESIVGTPIAEEVESSPLIPGRRRSSIRRTSNIAIVLEGPFDGLERSFQYRSFGALDEAIG